MRAFPPRSTEFSYYDNRFVSYMHDMFGFSDFCAANGNASAAWFSANDPLAIPFRVSEPVVFTHLGWLNGSAAGSNHDIGIYDASFNRVVSAGSTVGSGNNVWQYVDITDTALPTGFYYLVKVVDATTANRHNFLSHTSAVALMDFLGCKTTTTDSFPLPSSLSGMGTPAAARLPTLMMLRGAAF